MIWVWVACNSPVPPAAVPWHPGDLTLDIPPSWQVQANTASDPTLTRCGPGRVELVRGSTVADGVVTEGERCRVRTHRRTVGEVQIVCQEAWEEDGLGSPASVCASIVASAR